MKYLIIAGVLLMLASPVRAQDGMERYRRENERLQQQRQQQQRERYQRESERLLQQQLR